MWTFFKSPYIYIYIYIYICLANFAVVSPPSCRTMSHKENQSSWLLCRVATRRSPLWRTTKHHWGPCIPAPLPGVAPKPTLCFTDVQRGCCDRSILRYKCQCSRCCMWLAGASHTAQMGRPETVAIQCIVRRCVLFGTDATSDTGPQNVIREQFSGRSHSWIH
jgi:hypothetical protein